MRPVLLATLAAGLALAGPPPAKLKLDPFYRKYLDAGGIPVVASAQVPDEALDEARYLVDRMLARRPDLRKAIAKAGIRVAVMSVKEKTTDIPEHRDLTPKPYWDKRARGLGATHARPATSCAEENLLGYPGDPYTGECILIHEFAHTIHQIGLNAVDPKFEPRLKRIYRKAMKAKLWNNTYAATNFIEYWAEGVQCYFDCNLQANPPNGIHNRIDTREELAKYDPALSKLIAEVFRKDPWRWEGVRKKRLKANRR